MPPTETMLWHRTAIPCRTEVRPLAQSTPKPEDLVDAGRAVNASRGRFARREAAASPPASGSAFITTGRASAVRRPMPLRISRHAEFTDRRVHRVRRSSIDRWQTSTSLSARFVAFSSRSAFEFTQYRRIDGHVQALDVADAQPRAGECTSNRTRPVAGWRRLVVSSSTPRSPLGVAPPRVIVDAGAQRDSGWL